MFRFGIIAALGCLASMGGMLAQQPPPTPASAPQGTISGSIIDGTITTGSIINGTIQGTIPSTPSPPAGQGTAAPSVPGLSPPGGGGYRIISPQVQPTLNPGVLQLIDLEGRFAQAVERGGGKVFAQWFADDAVVLNDGKPAVLGRGAIAAEAQWDPKLYQLTWVAQGAQMGPSNDMGFTWGHYEGHATDAKGQPVVTSGRYMTVWKKTRESGWKVALDASASEPPVPAAASECCTVPKP